MMGHWFLLRVRFVLLSQHGFKIPLSRKLFHLPTRAIWPRPVLKAGRLFVSWLSSVSSDWRWSNPEALGVRRNRTRRKTSIIKSSNYEPFFVNFKTNLKTEPKQFTNYHFKITFLISFSTCFVGGSLFRRGCFVLIYAFSFCCVY